MKTYDPLERLRTFVARHPTQGAAARALGIGETYLSDILHKRREISAVILDRLGLVRVEQFVEKM